jgi:molybdopterin converting factor small subunit
VFARCSFIVNGVATTDRARVLDDGDSLDVLPPFAGG